MVMKPTPSKMVLLMSAAGLGLSWSGVVLASRDNNALTSLAWTFGTPPRSEKGCNTRALDGLASCPLSGGEILRTSVAEALALPLPLMLTYPSSDAKASLRAVNAYAATPTLRTHEARVGNGEPEPNDETPRPEAPVATRIVDGPNRDREAQAIAMVLLDDLQDVADATAAGAETTDRLASVPQRTLVQTEAWDSDADAQEHVGAGNRDRNPALGVDTTAAPGSELPSGSFDSTAKRARADIKGAAPVGAESSSTHEVKTSAAFGDEQADSPSVTAFRTDDRSEPTLSDAASIEGVFASLAEVLGSQLEESPRAFETNQRHTAAPKRDGEPHAAIAVVAVDPVPDVSAPPVDTTSRDSGPLRRSNEAADIVVASSHSDKVLLSLAALRSGEGPETGWPDARTNTTIVVRHTDKVLETLASFQSRTSKRAAYACFAHDVDIFLDLSPPVADRSAESVLQAAQARPAPSQPSAAARTGHGAFGNDLVAVSSDKLDEVRGGFVTDTGLKVSFGIERAVYIDGNLVTTTSLNIADLSKIAGGQAQVTGTGQGSLALVQSGAGNTFSPGSISSTAAGTVIQNTLDNKQINTVTRIDAVVNSSSIMRSMNLQSSMRSAIIDSLRR